MAHTYSHGTRTPSWQAHAIMAHILSWNILAWHILSSRSHTNYVLRPVVAATELIKRKSGKLQGAL